MQRSERHEAFQRLERGLINLDRLKVGFASMDDPMSDTGQREPFAVLEKPGRQMVQRLLMADLFTVAPARLGNDLPRGIGCHEARLAAESLELTAKNAARLARALGFKDLELQARRSGIKYEEDGRHASDPHRKFEQLLEGHVSLSFSVR